jgi:site-specific DNA-methyltransferase (adenine-specific)
MEIGKIYGEDCLVTMGRMPDKYIDLIIWDMPYNIGKAKWDKIKDYYGFLQPIFLECQLILKDNGSFYWFHNELPTIARLMNWLEENTEFVFKQLIVWDKWHNDFKKGNNLQGAFFKIVNNPGLRNYPKMAEYCLFYTFQDETGLTQIFENRDCFKSIKEYLRIEKIKTRDAGYSDHYLRELCGVSLKGGGLLSHYWGNAQWQLPIKEHYEKLQTTGFFQREYEDLRREYEDLRREYEDLRYTFNKCTNDTSIWQIPISNINERVNHETQKPEALIQNIILHSSNEGDLVYDPMCGSGTVPKMAIKLNRRWIASEISQEYVELANKRIKQYQEQLSLLN